MAGMTDAFVSYSRKDGEFVKKLVKSLQEAGKDVWVDWEDIPATADWVAEIYDGIENTNNFIYIISPHSLQSKEVERELNHALLNNKRLMPIVYIEPGEHRVHDSLASHNWIFFRENDEYEEALRLLMRAMDTDLEWVAGHTRILTKAVEWDKSDRDTSFLLRGSDLRNAEIWLDNGSDKEPRPAALQHEYLSASRRASDRRQRLILTAVTVALVVSIILTAIAALATQQAIQAQEQAESDRAVAEQQERESRSLALASSARNAISEYNPNLAIALALTADNILVESLPAVKQEVARAAYAPGAIHYLQDHKNSVFSVAFSPDGSMALSGDDNGNMRLWDLQTGQTLHVFSGHKDRIYSVAFSPDGNYAASSDEVGFVNIWNMEDYSRIGTHKEHGDVNVEAIAFDPSSQFLASGGDDTNIMIWDIARGEVIQTLEDHRGHVLSLTYSPDGRRIVSGSGDGGPGISDRTMRVWDVRSGTEISRLRQQHIGFVRAVAYSPQGNLIASGTWDDTNGHIRLWNPESGMEIQRLYGHIDVITSIAFDRDGKRLVSGSWDRSVRVWDLFFETGIEVGPEFVPEIGAIIDDSDDELSIERLLGVEVQRFDEHGDYVLGVAFSPDNNHILSAAGNPFETPNDTGIFYWDLRQRDQIAVFDSHRDWVRAIQHSPTGEYILTASGGFFAAGDTSIRMWDAETFEEIGIFEGHRKPVSGLAIAPDGETFASSSEDGTIIVWETATGGVKYIFRRQYGLGENGRDEIPITTIDISPDGQWVASGSEDGRLLLWALEDGALQHEFDVITTTLREEEVPVHVNGVDFDPLGRYLAVAYGIQRDDSPDNTIRIYDMETYEAVFELAGHVEATTDVSFSPDGVYLASSSSDETVKVWDLENDGALKWTLQGHNTPVQTVAFSPDVRHIFSGGQDSIIRMWDNASGQQVRRFLGHDTWVNDIDFSPDGSILLSAAGDNGRAWLAARTMEELQDWIAENRYVRVLDCRDAGTYELSTEECEDFEESQNQPPFEEVAASSP